MSNKASGEKATAAISSIVQLMKDLGAFNDEYGVTASYWSSHGTVQQQLVIVAARRAAGKLGRLTPEVLNIANVLLTELRTLCDDDDLQIVGTSKKENVKRMVLEDVAEHCFKYMSAEYEHVCEDCCSIY